MARKFLLDTDVIIWQLRGHEPTRELLKELGVEQPLSCSPVSVFEVWAGVRPREEAGTRELLGSLEVIPLDCEIALSAGETWRRHRAKGITLQLPDALIAATARLHGLVLVTYNRDHYTMDDVTLYEPMPPLG